MQVALRRLSVQTNYSHITAMLEEFGAEFRNENILFADGGATETDLPKSAACVGVSERWKG